MLESNYLVSLSVLYIVAAVSCIQLSLFEQVNSAVLLKVAYIRYLHEPPATLTNPVVLKITLVDQILLKREQHQQFPEIKILETARLFNRVPNSNHSLDEKSMTVFTGFVQD